MTPADDHSDPPASVRPVPPEIAYPTDPVAYSAAVQEGLDELDAGKGISGEAIIAWMRSWFTDSELPPPECGD